MRIPIWVWDYVFGVVVTLVGIAFVVFIVIMAIQDEERWDSFRSTHHCRVVSHVAGGTVTTFAVGTNGQPVIGTSSIPSKTGWLCDDGVTYYR